MGGSGGWGFRGYSPQEIRDWIEEAQRDTEQIEHDSGVNSILGDSLAQYNQRNVRLIQARLDEIEDAIEYVCETTVDLRFGGSIAKHTYVDGLSDVDALVILRDQELASAQAREVLDVFSEILRRELDYEVSVGEGRLAVTVSYPDGMEVQILPAVQTPSGIRIPSANSSEWSPVISPQVFAGKLAAINQACSNRLVPVVKLAKSALAELPEQIKPSGYHIESLAVQAFEEYSGPNNYKGMLHHFFQRASVLVLAPIEDSTGQSLNVDENLGEPNSQYRRVLSGVLDRIARRMAIADRARSLEDWLAAIGEAP